MFDGLIAVGVVLGVIVACVFFMFMAAAPFLLIYMLIDRLF